MVIQLVTKSLPKKSSAVAVSYLGLETPFLGSVQILL